MKEKREEIWDESSEEGEDVFLDFENCNEEEFNEWVDSLIDGRRKKHWLNYIWLWHYMKETHVMCKILLIQFNSIQLKTIKKEKKPHPH